MARGKTKSKVMANPILSLAGLAVILIAGMLVLGVGPFAASVAAPTPTDETVVDTGDVSYQCQSDTTPDVNIRLFDVENPGTAIAAKDGLYRNVDDAGSPWIAFTTDTAITNLIIGDTYEYVIGNTASDWTDNEYGPHDTFTVKCQELEVIYVGVYNDAVEGAVTTSFYYPVGHATSVSMSANTDYIFEITTFATTDLVFGNPFSPEPYPNMLNAHVNSTQGDKPNWVRANGIEMDSISCGTRVTGATGYIDYCFKLPVITESQMVIEISYNTDDSYTPAADETWNIYSGDNYVDSDTSDLMWGLVTEDDAAVGNADAETVTMDFTP